MHHCANTADRSQAVHGLVLRSPPSSLMACRRLQEVSVFFPDDGPAAALLALPATLVSLSLTTADTEFEVRALSAVLPAPHISSADFAESLAIAEAAL